jgi:putative C-S lyase
MKSPAFDFDAPIERRGTDSARWEKYTGRDVIPLWVADTDFRAPPAVLDALAARVAHGVLGYGVAPEELRHLIVERLAGLYAWRVSPQWLVFLPGVVPGLHLAARHLAGPQEHVLVPHPIYGHFRKAVQLAPRAASEMPLVLERGRWVFDEDAIGAAVRRETRLLMLCNPQNPGGTIFTRAELERLARIAERNDLVICSDDIHCELLLDAGKPHVPIASLSPEISQRTVTLMSPNKTFNIAGAGCAFAVIEDATLRQRFSVDLRYTVHDASLFGYVAAVAAYRDDREWLAAQLEYLRGNRDLVEQTVARQPGLSMAHVEATYLAWIDASALRLSDPHAHLLAHGLALSPGSDFGAPQFVRLNFGTQRALLREALARLATGVGAAQA